MELLHKDITEQIINGPRCRKPGSTTKIEGKFEPRINTDETREIQASGLVG